MKPMRWAINQFVLIVLAMAVFHAQIVIMWAAPNVMTAMGQGMPPAIIARVQAKTYATNAFRLAPSGLVSYVAFALERDGEKSHSNFYTIKILVMNFQTNALLAMFCIFSLSLKAQDTIRLKNGLMLYGLITEVNSKEVKFRVDGGSVTLDQVLSYQKGGQNVTLRNTLPTALPVATVQAKPQECEIKNVGDVEFENKSGYTLQIEIHAIGIATDDPRTNPIVTTISVPANTTVTAYELTSGVHYWESFGYGTGQVKVIKCGIAKFVLQPR